MKEGLASLFTSVDLLSSTQAQQVQEQFPSVVDLREKVHFTYWSELHLITQSLFVQLPFGQIFSTTCFYHLIDFQLEDLIAAAQQTLSLWVLIGVQQYNGSLVDQLALFHDKTFLWHYSVPVTIHPHFSLPPRPPPSYHQCQQHQHLMSTIQYQRQSYHLPPYRPVTPPPCLPSYHDEDPALWQSMTKGQRKAAKDRRRAEQPHRQHQYEHHLLTVESPTCSDPLCRLPHLLSPSQTPCSLTTSPPLSTPSTGSQGTPVILCSEKDSRVFKCPVSAQFPRTVQLVLQDVTASPVEDTPPTSLLALKISPFPLSRKDKLQAWAASKARRLGQDALHSAPSSPSPPSRLIKPIPQRKLGQPLITPYLEDIQEKPLTDLLDLRRRLLLSFPNVPALP